jgi:hypothetical protein
MTAMEQYSITLPTASGEHGVWSDAAGGFVDTQLYGQASMREALDALIAQGEDPEDLKVLAICPEHEEQVADTCDECLAEDDED